MGKIRKLTNKIGKAIKKIAEPLWDGLKKVLKPIGKVFSKLGPIGTIGLGIMLPGIGSVVGSWFNAAGGAFQGLFAPGSFMHNVVGGIGDFISQGANSLLGTESALGKAYGSITDVISAGVNVITEPFLGKGKGLATRIANFTANFTDRFSIKTKLDLPDGIDNSISDDADLDIAKIAESYFPEGEGQFGDTPKPEFVGSPEPVGRDMNIEQLEEQSALRESLLQRPLKEDKPESSFDTSDELVAQAKQDLESEDIEVDLTKDEITVDKKGKVKMTTKDVGTKKVSSYDKLKYKYKSFKDTTDEARELYEQISPDEEDIGYAFHNPNIDQAFETISYASSIVPFTPVPLNFIEAAIGATEESSIRALMENYVSSWGSTIPEDVNPVWYADNQPSSYGMSLDRYLSNYRTRQP